MFVAGSHEGRPQIAIARSANISCEWIRTQSQSFVF
jgi:hypothetical protein